jgi:hypothetical protein
MGDVFVLGNCTQTQLAMDVKTPPIYTLAYELSVLCIPNLKADFLDLIDSDYSKIVCYEILIELCDLVSTNLVIDGKFGSIFKSNTGDKVSDLLWSPINDGWSLFFLQNSEVGETRFDTNNVIQLLYRTA